MLPQCPPRLPMPSLLMRSSFQPWRLLEMVTTLSSLRLSTVLFSIGFALHVLQVHKLPAFLSISIFHLIW